MEDLSDVEEALRGRMRATLEAATAVLQLVEEAAARGGGGGAADGGSGGAGDGALPSPGGGKGGVRAATNSKDAQLAALNNLLKAENNRLRDQALLDATKIKQLASSLAGARCCALWGVAWAGWAACRRGRGRVSVWRCAWHMAAVAVCSCAALPSAGPDSPRFCCPQRALPTDREDELLVAQRKVNQLKTAAAGGAAVMVAGAPAAAAGAAGAGSPTPAAGAGAVVVAADGAGAERLHQLLQKRTAELEEREDALIKADRCAWGRGQGSQGRQRVWQVVLLPRWGVYKHWCAAAGLCVWITERGGTVTCPVPV